MTLSTSVDMGGKAATVYRDKSGKRLESLAEAGLQKMKDAGIKTREEEVQEKFEWGVGTAQKNEMATKMEDLEKMKSSSFARFEDDKGINDMLKSRILADDPMAAYLASKKPSKIVNSQSQGPGAVKPKYQGPLGAPNRFQIHPGYRWGE